MLYPLAKYILLCESRRSSNMSVTFLIDSKTYISNDIFFCWILMSQHGTRIITRTKNKRYSFMLLLGRFYIFIHAFFCKWKRSIEKSGKFFSRSSYNIRNSRISLNRTSRCHCYNINWLSQDSFKNILRCIFRRSWFHTIILHYHACNCNTLKVSPWTIYRKMWKNLSTRPRFLAQNFSREENEREKVYAQYVFVK